MSDPRRCFVVMGFGTKTDLATGRKLNLDKSYNALIKPVVEHKGLVCVRADEIRHSGTIDIPMYQELLNADVVIADISTANPNALYELGVRHALRPQTTIVISEQELTYPFDLNHILIIKYSHLGENIDYFEVLRFQKLLGETIDAVLASGNVDSPIYTFLDDLVPPAFKKILIAQIIAPAAAPVEAPMAGGVTRQNQTLSLVVKQAEEAMDKNEFAMAKILFKSAILLQKSGEANRTVAPDSYLIHRCAYAAYKSEEPNELTALLEANNILNELDLAHTNDSETVILAGKIEKRLYFNSQGEQHLANAILYFERGFFLLNNRYNGINLAFLMNIRASSNIYIAQEEKIADVVFASRIRRMVLAKCNKELLGLSNKVMPGDSVLPANDSLAANQQIFEGREKFWILVNKAEALFGLGQMAEYKQARQQANDLPHEPWMMKTFIEQWETLQTHLQQQANLFNPPWSEI